MLKRPMSPPVFSNLTHQICYYPSSPYSRNGDYTYQPHRDGDAEGSFQLSIFGGEVQFRGRWFSTQEAVDNYRRRRGIALNSVLTDFNTIRGVSRGGGSVIFFEEIFYAKPVSQRALIRIKALLKTTTDPLGSHGRDKNFLYVRLGELLHVRTGQSIPPNEWVPLYRHGSIFGQQPDDLVNTESYEHAIF